MKLERIVAVVIRLFAIVLALYALRNGVAFAVYLYRNVPLGASYAYGGFMIALLILCVGLWYFPLTLAKGLMPLGSNEKEEESSISSEQLLMTGIIILGIYLLFGVVSDIFYWIGFYLISSSNLDASIVISLEQKALMLATVIEAVFVTVLLLGRKRLVEFFNRFRY